MDSNLIPIGNTFSFQNNYNGFHNTLWKKLKQYLESEIALKTEAVFLVEIACELIRLAKQYSTYYSVRSLKRVSDKMAVLFTPLDRAIYSTE